MTEITSGARRILSHPLVYCGLRDVLGLNRWLQRYVRTHVHPRNGDRVLDVGCGTGEIVRYLAGTNYTGIDRHRPYIEFAARNFGDKGRFVCADLADCLDDFRGDFDIVTANGLLHHVDDELAAGLFAMGRAALRPGGRMITVDPCHFDGQPKLARFVIDRDRGRNVRRPEEYAALAGKMFSRVSSRLWAGYTPVPFSVAIVECTRDSI